MAYAEEEAMVEVLGKAETETLALLRSKDEIRDVLARYCRGADRKDYDMLRSAYHPDASDNRGSYKGDVEGLIEWLKPRHHDVDQSMHFIGNCLIEVKGDRAFAETYAVAIQHRRAGEGNSSSGQPTYRRITMGLRYADNLQRRNGEWRISDRVVICEWLREEEGDLSLPGDDWTIAVRSKEDASYRLWHEAISKAG